MWRFYPLNVTRTLTLSPFPSSHLTLIPWDLRSNIYHEIWYLTFKPGELNTSLIYTSWTRTKPNPLGSADLSFFLCSYSKSSPGVISLLFCVTSISNLSSFSLTGTFPWFFSPEWGPAMYRFRSSHIEPCQLHLAQRSIYCCFSLTESPLPSGFFPGRSGFLDISLKGFSPMLLQFDVYFVY